MDVWGDAQLPVFLKNKRWSPTAKSHPHLTLPPWQHCSILASATAHSGFATTTMWPSVPSVVSSAFSIFQSEPWLELLDHLCNTFCWSPDNIQLSYIWGETSNEWIGGSIFQSFNGIGLHLGTSWNSGATRYPKAGVHRKSRRVGSTRPAWRPWVPGPHSEMHIG